MNNQATSKTSAFHLFSSRCKTTDSPNGLESLAKQHWPRQRLAVAVEGAISARWRQLAAIGVLALAALGNANAADLTWNLTDSVWNKMDPYWLTPTGDSAVYADGDNVTFTTDHAGNVQVDDAGSPGNVNIDSDADYTFSGNSINTSGTLTKSGKGKVTFENYVSGANTFARIVINEGTLAFTGNLDDVGFLSSSSNLPNYSFDIASNAAALSEITSVVDRYLTQTSSAFLADIRTEIDKARGLGLATIELTQDTTLGFNNEAEDGFLPPLIPDNHTVLPTGGLFSAHLDDNAWFEVESSISNGTPGGVFSNSGTMIMTAVGHDTPWTADELALYLFINSNAGGAEGSVLANLAGAYAYIENAIFEQNGGDTGDQGTVSNRGKLVLNSATFYQNKSKDGYGSLALLPGSQTTLVDSWFFINDATYQTGAAVTLADNAKLTQVVNVGMTSYYMMNALYEKGSGSNLIGHRSIAFNGNAEYVVQTEADASGGVGTLRMLDPMKPGQGESISPTITKRGGGIWQLADVNDFTDITYPQDGVTATVGTLTMNVAEGTLELLAAGSETTNFLGYDDWEDITYTWRAGSFKFKSGSTLTIASGAALLLDGGNSIDGGLFTVNGELQFDLTNANATTAMLSVSSALPEGSKLGESAIRLLNENSTPTAGAPLRMRLLDAITANRVADSGSLYVNDATTPAMLKRDKTPGAKMYDLQIADGRYLDVVIADATQNTNMTWTHAQDHIWDNNTTGNWSGIIDTIPVTTFLAGDNVTFSSVTQGDTITVVEAGVTVNNMKLAVSHAFVGGVITADTVNVSDNARLGLVVGTQPAMQIDSTLSFAGSSGLDVVGASLTADEYVNPHVVINSNNIQDFKPENATIFGHSQVDFMGSDVVQSADGKQLLVTLTLAWHDLIANSAHGEFTLPEADDAFTLGTSLADNSDTVSHREDWDGKTLTKKGDGTLVLTGQNTYSGKTIINSGTLQLGNGGANDVGTLAAGTAMNGVAISAGATLAFNHHDSSGAEYEFDQQISGEGGIRHLGWGTTKLGGDHTFTGPITIDHGTLIITGSLGNNPNGNHQYDGDIVINGTALQMGQAASTANHTPQTQTLSGNISGPGGFTHYGEGTTILTGNNSWIGDTRVEQGTLIGNLPPDTDLTLADSDAVYIGAQLPTTVSGSWSGSFAGALAAAQPVARSIGELNGSGTVQSVASLTVQSGDFSGVIDASNGDLYKVNDTLLTLSGANAYKGQTHIVEGTLALRGPGRLGDNILNLYQGATLDVSQADFGIDRSGRELYLRALAADPAPATGVHVAIITAPGKQVNFANATLHFEMPTSFTQNDVLLNVSGGGTVDVSHANVQLYATGGLLQALKEGDYVTLIHADAPLTGGETLDQQELTVRYGVTDYGFYLAHDQQGAAANLNAYYDKKHPNENAGSLTYGNAARGAMLVEGFDQTIAFLDHWKYSRLGVFAPGTGEKASGLTPFATTSVASIKNKIGSEVKSKSFTLMGGMAWDGQLGNGDILAGAFVDTGRGHYDSSMDATPDGDGDGKTWFVGGGLFAKYTDAAHWYVEASARAGKAHVEYDGKDALASLHYKSDTPYWGMHIGGGYGFHLADNKIIDVYLKGMWQSLNKDKTTTSLGEELEMKKYTSKRSRLGVRYIHDNTENFRWLVGAAWDHEFDGKSEVEVNQMQVNHQNELKGNTGIAHLGVEWNLHRVWNIEAGVSGMVGKRQGGELKVMATYRF